MIRTKCPRCAQPVAVNETQAAAAVACTQCGQKFRVKVPASPAARPPSQQAAIKPAARPPAKPRPVEDVEELEEAVLLDDEAIEPAPPKAKRVRPVLDVEDEDDEPPPK